MGESVAGWVAANGKPLLLNGQVSAGDYSGAEPREMPVASSLCLPLESGNRSIGVMSVNRYEEGDPFTPEDLELITVFANNAAIAIHNAGMYAKLREFSSDLERKVRERTRQLEVANRAKSDFLASVSHELRTPLHAITGFCDVLLKERHGSLNPDQREYAREIQTAGNRLLAIIDGVLDFSAAEAGRMDLSLEDVPLVPVVRNAPAPVNKRVQDKGLRMETHWDESLEGASIRANPGGLEQVLSHLLSNAVEFTRPGGAVRVEAAAVEDCGARLRELEAEGLISTGERGRHKGMDGLQGVELSVSDDGEGIPPDQRFRVFEPFFQGGEGLSGNRPGTGLGLARAQRLVEVHGGRIWAESEGKGKGSRFAFLLPLDPEGNGRPQPPNDAARGR
jgi:signal transduction histidine kinase